MGGRDGDVIVGSPEHGHESLNGGRGRDVPEDLDGSKNLRLSSPTKRVAEDGDDDDARNVAQAEEEVRDLL